MPRCPLYADTTQKEFLLLGEQPGDQEDRQGKPFVGPAGHVLDRALADAGVDPEHAHVTNAVEHFRFTVQPGRKRRIHKSPSLREMTARRPWLPAELRLVSPEVVVALGATAGKALLGSGFRVTEQRGALLSWPGLDGEAAEDRIAGLLATIHPSAVLRADDRDAVYDGLVADLRVVADVLRRG